MRRLAAMLARRACRRGRGRAKTPPLGRDAGITGGLAI
jgi:hypothetical protein